MSRQIDLTKPLSDEDRAYLKARNRTRDIAIADGLDHPNMPDDRLEASTERSPSATPAALAAQNPDGAPAADSPLASPVTEHTVDTQTEASGESEQDAASGDDPEASGETEQGDNYDDEDVWSYDDLKDEVKGREAEDSPALNSKREVLIAWLREDDARPDATDAS